LGAHFTAAPSANAAEGHTNAITNTANSSSASAKERRQFM
jgi:hypothetical protein